MKAAFLKKEKKVEYLELIYDLIFVYVIGRNNSLLHHTEDGFVGGTQFLAYFLFTLTVIQIWNFSTYYINMHGRNGVRDHVCLFINMYLLYFIGKGTRLDYDTYRLQYLIAWGLILVNVGLQYLIERRNHRDDPQVQKQTLRMGLVLFGEALLVFLSIPAENLTSFTLAPVAIAFGVVCTMIHGKRAKVPLVDFSHLTERAMLYVVLTFGEMILALVAYFDEGFSLNSVYFSLMAFLIVVGLFLGYETMYDHLIDREKQDSGLGYMLLHILLVFALNLITVSLEFMQNEAVELIPKMVMLLSAFLLYYLSLFLLLKYGKQRCRPKKRFVVTLSAAAAVFIVLMLVFRNYMYVNIALSVVFVFGIFAVLFWFREKTNLDFQSSYVTGITYKQSRNN